MPSVKPADGLVRFKLCDNFAASEESQIFWRKTPAKASYQAPMPEKVSRKSLNSALFLLVK